MHLKRYFQRLISLGWRLPPSQTGEWYLTPNPNWNWGRDGRERARDQIKATGWPDEDGEPIKPPECK